MAWIASRSLRPAMVVNSPGTHKMTSWPTRRIWMSTMLGCLQDPVLGFKNLRSDFKFMIQASKAVISKMSKGSVDFHISVESTTLQWLRQQD